MHARSLTERSLKSLTVYVEQRTVPSAGRCVTGSARHLLTPPAGVIGQESQRVVAEALIVASCESNLDPTASAFGGTFAAAAHPDTGLPYDRQGLFGLSSAMVVAFAGPDVSPFDPAISAAVAAQLWLSERAAGRSGWDPFGCAATAAFHAVSVLPSYGGPELPAWAIAAAGI